ncbi:Na+/H+ antiporter subunit B [Algisphaera agarilytica]|uniref:Multicomponent Na+:H+ antiporter subunit B n=1 Tax=Algisphaera agarilytica TaxID=1385975 RepID=A0A7X0H374_9BACT|nr:Na+/H+ antiporter subunit B [Algisphaera agarilytica]MBB6428441.1 multicomponent Na+:H+ antiporter subunit B [Algisphaera agarilytica]
MNAPVLQTTAKLLVLLLAVFSILVLIRGHNEPGGGFIGGLLCALAFATHALSFGIRSTRRLLRVDPHRLLGIGLILALGSGVASMVLGQPFMTGQWLGEVPGIGKVGSVLVFDVGVYLVVLGTATMILVGLMGERD